MAWHDPGERPVEDQHFDELSRSFAGGHTRRSVLRRLSAAGLASGLPLLATSVIDARRRKKKRKKKRPVPQPTCPPCAADQRCVNGSCVTQCTPDCAGKACGAGDSCGGTCQTGACGECKTCQAGACVAVADGTGCDTGNLCVLASNCQAGVCTVQIEGRCFPPDNVCLTASCNSESGICENQARTAGYPCDTTETCMFTHGACDGQGACVSTPISCSDSRQQCCPSGAYVGQCRRKSGKDCSANIDCCSDSCVLGTCW